MTANPPTEVTKFPSERTEESQPPRLESVERCYLCGRSAANLGRLADSIQKEVSERYAKHLAALDVAILAKETLLHQLTALRGHPALEIHADGSREVGGLLHAGFLPKDPELSVLLKPGGYVERLTGDSELWNPVRRRETLSAYLEAAIQLEERRLKAFVSARSDLRMLLEQKPETLFRRSTVVAMRQAPSSVIPRRDRFISSGGAGFDLLEDMRDPSREVRQYDASRDHEEVLRVLSNLEVPESLITVSVPLCAVCAGFLDARREAESKAIGFSDDDDEASHYSDEGADDNPADDWQSDSSD